MEILAKQLRGGPQDFRTSEDAQLLKRRQMCGNPNKSSSGGGRHGRTSRRQKVHPHCETEAAHSQCIQRIAVIEAFISAERRVPVSPNTEEFAASVAGSSHEQAAAEVTADKVVSKVNRASNSLYGQHVP